MFRLNEKMFALHILKNMSQKILLPETLFKKQTREARNTFMCLQRSSSRPFSNGALRVKKGHNLRSDLKSACGDLRRRDYLKNNKMYVFLEELLWRKTWFPKSFFGESKTNRTFLKRHFFYV